VENLLLSNQNHVKIYLSGKEKLLGFFVGQVVKETDGKANPGIVRELLIRALKDMRG